MPLAEFEPTIPKTERLHTHALDRAATEIGDGTSLGPKLKTQNVKKVYDFESI